VREKKLKPEFRIVKNDLSPQVRKGRGGSTDARDRSGSGLRELHIMMGTERPRRRQEAHP